MSSTKAKDFQIDDIISVNGREAQIVGTSYLPNSFVLLFTDDNSVDVASVEGAILLSRLDENGVKIV